MPNLDRLQGILDHMVSDRYVAGANALVYQHGKEIGYYQAGFSDIAANKPMNRDTICHLYSMSKPIMAAAVFLLVEDGKIDLIDPIEKFFPEYANLMVQEGDKLVPAKRSIFIKDLLNMQSGLLYPGNTGMADQASDKLFSEMISKMETPEEMTTKEVVAAMGSLPLAFHPGERWHYGISADVLGGVVEVVSGITLGEFMKTRLFDPLEMKDTGFYVPDDKKDRMAKAYVETPDGPVEFHLNHLAIHMDMNNVPRFESGGAGLVSTLDDYMHFGQMLLNGGVYNGKRIMGKATVDLMTKGHLPKAIEDDLLNWSGLEGFTYANLMRVCDNPSLAMYEVTKGAYGWDGWLGPYFANDPENDLTVVFMQQRTDSGTTGYTRRFLNVLMSSLD